jgi:hypothetical protein
MSSWQCIWVRKEDIEYLHACFIWVDSIDLKHKIIKISDVLHPASCIQVRLLLEHEAFNTKDLNSFEELHQSLLVISHVKWNELLLLLFPIINRT